MHSIPGNARYSVRKETGRILSGLKGKELRCLGHQGFIKPNDKIQKQGHKTWHDSRDVLGLLLEQDKESCELPIVVTENSPIEIKKSKNLENAIINSKLSKTIQVKPNDNIVFKTVKRICNAHIIEKKATKISAILRNRSLLASAYDQLTNQQFRNTWFKMDMDSQILLLNSIRIADTPRESSRNRHNATRELAITPNLALLDFVLFRRITHAKDGLKTLNPNFKTEYGRSWTVYSEEF